MVHCSDVARLMFGDYAVLGIMTQLVHIICTNVVSGVKLDSDLSWTHMKKPRMSISDEDF
jgi:hypothetical protein